MNYIYLKTKQLIQNQTVLVGLVLILTFGVRTYYVFQKEGLHLDEVLSVILSSYNDYSWFSNYDEDKIYTGKELKEITLFDNSSIKNALKDVYFLRLENRDRPHTNLYYSLLRLWFTGTQTGDIHRIIVQGCLLNLLFFSLSFFFMYKLLKLLFKNKWIILLALVVAFLNVGSISNTLYIRPYQLQETIFILFVYLFVHFYQKIELKKPIDSWQNLLLIALIVSLTLLSGYFAIFLVFFFGVFLLYKLYKEKQIKNIYFIISAFVSAIVLTFAIFPRYERGFLTYKGKEAISKFIEGNPMDNLLLSLKRLIETLHENLFYTSTLLLLCVVFCYLLWEKRQNLHTMFKRLKILPIILLISLMWVSVVMIAAPIKTLSYIFPAIPLLSLFIPYIILKINKPKIFVLSLLFCIGIYGVVAFNKERISFLFLDTYKEMKFNQNPEIPVIIYNNTALWKSASLIPYVADNQKYEFPHSDKSLFEKAMKYPKAILLIETSTDIDIKNVFDNYVVEKFDFGYSAFFTAYYIVKKTE